MAGRISPILYWYEGAGLYWLTLDPSSPPSLPLGTGLHLVIGWINESSGAIIGHIDLTVTRPDGSQLAPPAVAYQDLQAAPGNGWLVQFAPVTLDQAGSWSGKAVLSGG